MAFSYICLFAIILLSTSASSLKCYIGVGTAAIHTDCPTTSTLDVCTSTGNELGTTAVYACGLKSVYKALTHPGDGCKTITVGGTSARWCLETPIQCYVGVGTAAVKTDCPVDTTSSTSRYTNVYRCITSGTGTTAVYECGLRSVYTALTHPGDGCKTITAGSKLLKTCLCKDPYCNDPSKTPLKCYVGQAFVTLEKTWKHGTAGEHAVKKTDCPDTTTVDVCTKSSAPDSTPGSSDTVMTTACGLKSEYTDHWSIQHPGDGCKTDNTSSTEWCLCKTDYCNDPAVKKSSASTQSAFQLSAMIFASCLIKLLMA